MSMMEAECTRCKEIFVPHGTTPEDLIHGYSEEQDKDCGGIGVIAGQWMTPTNESKLLAALTPQERHGKENPHCEDPDCEFHHPELTSPFGK